MPKGKDILMTWELAKHLKNYIQLLIRFRKFRII